ncbi:MAG TPA: ABC transporter ATP-binding protein, partial [Terriglobales bacterium]|nr:ABC transporter ATP-binding protein [Terriglobales bacterium]
MILEAANVDTFYGTSHILQEVSLSVGKGEVVALLGRNGVGKTTTLRSIMGLSPPKRGSIRLRGKEISGIPPYEVARLGVAYVPDDLRIFPDLTAEENLQIARRLSGRDGYWNRERVYELFPKLSDLGPAKGINLSGGEKKMLGIGRALMANPSLILLDEPSEGLAPLVVANLVD